MTYTAVIFDLDGTLLDTRADIGDAMNRVLAKNGFPTHSIEAYGTYLGSGARALVTRALPEAYRDEEIISTYLETFQKDYAQNCTIKTEAYPGIQDLITELSARKFKLGILTNKPHDITLVCVRELFPQNTFQVVLGHQEGQPHKPDPAGVLQVINDLGVAPNKILYLGDSDVDMETALNAGITPVGVSWGFRSVEVLTQSGAQIVIDHPLDLLNYL